jgi:hypothetical protein
MKLGNYWCDEFYEARKQLLTEKTPSLNYGSNHTCTWMTSRVTGTLFVMLNMLK